MSKEVEFPTESNFPIKDSHKEMISIMLEKDPSKRATMKQLKQHEWVNEGFTLSLTKEESKQGIMSHLKNGDINISEETVAFATKLAKAHSKEN